MNRYFFLPAALALGLLTAIPASSAKDENAKAAAPKGRETCVSLKLVEQTLILDDRNIVYRMRGGKLYLNTLPSVCGGLFDQGNYMFQGHNPYRICRGDTFQVFRVLTGCKLGYFDPISEDQFNQMKRERTAARAKAGKPSN
jgi:hypothetical protein